jgi:hypothetical protein
VRVKPGNGLKECLLLSILVDLAAQITAHSKSVHNATVQVNLIGLFGIDEDSFRLVTLLSREDMVRLGGGD